MNRRLLPLAAIVLICFAGCTPDSPPVSLDPPPTPVLTSESLWGVANKPYVRVLESNSPNADVAGLLRRGDMAEVLSKIGDPEGKGYWLEIRLSATKLRGWVGDADMDVYDSEAQARTARSELLAD